MKKIAAAIILTTLSGASAYAAANGPFKVALLRDNDLKEMRLAQADAASPYRRAAPSRSRLRDGPRPAIFVRGGYSFAASGPSLADGAGTQIYSAGYRVPLSARAPVSVEAEVVFQRDRDTVLIGLGQEEATRRAISGLVSVRYDGPHFGPFRPFVSGGFGPVQVKSTIDNGVTPIEDSSIELGYVGRVGLVLPITDRWSAEAGYRFLGATNDDVKTHSAELGLSWSF
ncbi:MAG: outer membrane beta-barrel protein [Parvularculaceae bacterium]